MNPKPREDQKCLQCGKPKKRTRNAADGANAAKTGYTRVNRKMWLDSLELDPFCSRECCEAWAGTNETPTMRVCEYGKCAETFPVSRGLPGQRFCSKRCRDYSKKARKFDVPGRCAGCGGEMEGSTAGCTHCSDRRRTRLRREGEYKPSKRSSNGYATEEERVAARRISWRDSKQRQRAAA